ncbi:MAG: hypothetical protein E4H01_02935 [Lysobacterales bacterium]|nr:MAG: hypothetical protein E4H01_02935 [Xanthomonadales bacterium]
MIVYEGPSMINRDPIIAIVTGLVTPSTNRKTGPMAQLWILDATTEPHIAVKTGEDESVCGDCPARNKWCYVTTFQGPLSIYRTWKRGGYQQYNPSLLAGKILRFGAYGDPAAVPIEVIRDIGRRVRRFTGYTHAWKYCDSEFQHYCMASVDTVSDQAEAARRGWRTFRVAAPDTDRLKGESVCPASEEAGHKIDCYTCGACDGRRRKTVKGHIVIQAHGAKTKRYVEEFA